MKYSKNLKNLILEIEKRKNSEKKILFINKIIFFITIIVFIFTLIFSFNTNNDLSEVDYYSALYQ